MTIVLPSQRDMSRLRQHDDNKYEYRASLSSRVRGGEAGSAEWHFKPYVARKTVIVGKK